MQCSYVEVSALHQTEPPQIHNLGDRVMLERAGEPSPPFETETDHEAFRTEEARVLDMGQLDRVKEGNSDALENVLEI
jgi:type IV secretion system T-DNA border endonuclease VirD2